MPGCTQAQNHIIIGENKAQKPLGAIKFILYQPIFPKGQEGIR